MLRAKHNFKLQIKPGEFVQFKAGETIPKQYYEGNSPYAVFIRDHCESGILKPQVVIPDMVRVREMPEHVKEQELARAKAGMTHPVDLPTTVNAGTTIPQKQTGAPQPVPKIEPKVMQPTPKIEPKTATPVQVKKVMKPAHKR